MNLNLNKRYIRNSLLLIITFGMVLSGGFAALAALMLVWIFFV